MNALRTFYTLIITQIASLIGSRMTGIAVGIYVFKQTGNAAPLLVAAFFAEIPGLLIGSFTGILADRFDRRYVIMLGDAGGAFGTLLLMFSFQSGEFQLWHLYAVMLLQGIFGTLQAPASLAAITMLVPENQRDRANSIQQIGFPLAGVIAPITAGLLYGVVGVVGVMVVDLLTFFAAIFTVSLIHIPHPKQPVTLPKGLWEDMLQGWVFLAARRPLLIVIVYIAFIYFLINGPLEMAIPYISTMTSNATILGILLGVMNFGAFSGAMSLAIIGKIKYRIHAIFLSFVWLGVMFLIYGVIRQPIFLAITLFFLYFPLPLSGTLITTILQAKTPPHIQGRVFAVTGQLFVVATPFSFLITGALVDLVLEPAVGKSGWKWVEPLVGSEAGAGMGMIMLGTGCLILVTTLLVYLLPKVRAIETQIPDAE